MDKATQFLQQKLNDRKKENRLRRLTYSKAPVDFCSNDYLGFARSEELYQLTEAASIQFTEQKNGSTGSRLISGNHPYTEETEKYIAAFHDAPAALFFNSGYDANTGLLSSVPQRGDTIIADELIHASLIDGARLSYATRLRFKHNDLSDLETKLKKATGLCYVVVESIYSMDGDTAPLAEIAALCRQYNANLIIDEAHATGVFGPKGSGLTQELGLQNQVFARIVTYGKALGSHGAVVLGSEALRQYLINFARSFIYTTAAPLKQVTAVKCAYQLLEKHAYPDEIRKKINLYNSLLRHTDLMYIPGESCIQTILFNNSKAAKNAAVTLQKKGFDVRAIVSPTVPEGKERLRICLHLYNTDEEIKNLISAITDTI